MPMVCCYISKDALNNRASHYFEDWKTGIGLVEKDPLTYIHSIKACAFRDPLPGVMQ